MFFTFFFRFQKYIRAQIHLDNEKSVVKTEDGHLSQTLKSKAFSTTIYQRCY